MKPRIFIAIHYLELGGAEISLIGLLNAIDTSQYDVDLFIYSHQGELMKMIPSGIHLLPEVKEYAQIEKPIKEVLKQGGWKIAIARLWAKYKYSLYAKRNKLKDNAAILHYISESIIPFLPSLKKYGEYVFQVQPFSESCSPGNIHEIRAESLAAPVVYEFSSTEMNLTANDIYVEGIRDSEPQNLLDGDTETFVNTDYSQPAGTVFWIDFTLPKEQEFLKFSYINRNHSAASFPSEIECYVKANENDEWTLLKTLTAENDALPTDPLGRFTSSEYQAPFAFNYFRFRVPRTHTGNPNFSLAEFRVFDVSYTFVDPEAE